MSAAKHTPGPWLPYDEDMADPEPMSIGIFSGDELIASASALTSEEIEPGVHTLGEDRDLEEVRANARLIAAAPDLLAALKRCRFDSLNMSLSDLEFCRAAIAKAEGGAS